MPSSIHEFPIAGAAVGSALINAQEKDAIWILKGIETLANPPATELGELWRQTLSGEVSIEASKLANVLTSAFQVVYLDIFLKVDPKIKLCIEDGEVVENSL